MHGDTWNGTERGESPRSNVLGGGFLHSPTYRFSPALAETFHGLQFLDGRLNNGSNAAETGEQLTRACRAYPRQALKDE